jgi:hypothetical protein
MGISPDDPIENLKLSNRTRNVLRRMGCATLGSVMNHEAGLAWRRPGFGFGPVSRAEVACALAANGLTPWAEMLPTAQMGARFRPRQRRPGAPAKRSTQLADGCKTPLTVIRAASSGLLETKTLTPEQRELAELIETESVRLCALLHGLVDTPRRKVGRTAGAAPIER